MAHRWGCLKKWVGLVTAMETLGQRRAQSMVGAAKTRSSWGGGMDGSRGPTPTTILYLQKQDVQAGFLHPNLLGAVGAS